MVMMRVTKVGPQCLTGKGLGTTESICTHSILTQLEEERTKNSALYRSGGRHAEQPTTPPGDTQDKQPSRTETPPRGGARAHRCSCCSGRGTGSEPSHAFPPAAFGAFVAEGGGVMWRLEERRKWVYQPWPAALRPLWN